MNNLSPHAIDDSGLDREESSTNSDSLPLAAGVGGFIGGAAAGAAVGALGGPLGALFGATVGAVTGGLGADAVASSFDESEVHDYWRSNFSSRPYVRTGASYDEYGPAYVLGSSARHSHPEGRFEDMESELAGEWERTRGQSSLGWDNARLATRDAWDRLANT